MILFKRLLCVLSLSFVAQVPVASAMDQKDDLLKLFQFPGFGTVSYKSQTWTQETKTKNGKVIKNHSESLQQDVKIANGEVIQNNIKHEIYPSTSVKKLQPMNVLPTQVITPVIPQNPILPQITNNTNTSGDVPTLQPVQSDAVTYKNKGGVWHKYVGGKYAGRCANPNLPK